MTGPSFPNHGSDEGEVTTPSSSSGLPRFYCPLPPCIPTEFVQVGGYNREQIRQSMSFATEDGYLRHIEKGHFIARANAPKPFILGGEQKAQAA